MPKFRDAETGCIVIAWQNGILRRPVMLQGRKTVAKVGDWMVKPMHYRPAAMFLVSDDVFRKEYEPMGDDAKRELELNLADPVFGAPDLPEER